MELLEHQKTGSDCGPTALHGALKLLGIKAYYQDVYRLAGTDPDKGTSAAGLKRALEALKVSLKEYSTRNSQSAWNWIRKQTQPTILAVDNDDHWVLLIAGMGRRVVIFDPEQGLMVYGRRDFMARWTSPSGGFYGIQLLQPESRAGI